MPDLRQVKKGIFIVSVSAKGKKVIKINLAFNIARNPFGSKMAVKKKQLALHMLCSF